MALISIIIPVYQGAGTISQAIDSVLDQSFKDYEIIVVDDGSKDNLDEVLSRYGNSIKLIKQSKSGVAPARNHGIRNSSGEFIAFLDADDIWLPDKLSRQIELFTINPHLGVVYGNVNYWDGNVWQRKTYFDFMQPYRGKIAIPLFAVNFIPFLSVMMRRKILDDVGLFDESIRFVEDYDLLLRIALDWEFDYIQKPIGAYRISNQQVSKNHIQAAENLLNVKESYYLKNKNFLVHVDRKVLNRGLYNKYLRLAMWYMRAGRTDDTKMVLERYRRIKGVSVLLILIHIINYFPRSVKFAFFRLWEKYHQKPEYGIY